MKNSIKKVIAGLSVAAMFASVMPIVNAWYDEDVDIDNFNYHVDEELGGVVIEEYVGPGYEEIIIPEEIDGEPVVSIDTLAFASVTGDATIYVPEGVDPNILGWEPFLTSGALNKGILNVDLEDEEKTPVNIIKYWGDKANVDPAKLTDKYIYSKLNEAIDMVVNKAEDLIPDFDIEGIQKEIKDVVNGLDIDVPTIDTGKIEAAITDLQNFELQETEALIKALNTADDEYRMFLLNQEIKKQIDVKIKAVDDEIKAVQGDINSFTTDAQDKISETQKNALDKINSQFVKIQDSLDNLDIASLKDQIKEIDSYVAICTAIDTAPDKVLELITNSGATVEDSLVSSALKVVKNYKADEEGFIENLNLSDANKTRVKKAMNKVEKVFDNHEMPYTGLTLVVSPYNADVDVFEEYAGDRGIEFETGEPEEPTVETSIIVSEVPGETSIVYSEVSGETVTSIVTIPGEKETVTSIVTIPGEKETVTSIVTSYVDRVSVSVSVSVSEVTVLVPVTTEETTKKDILKGDTNQDGIVDIQDVIWVAQYMIDKRELTGDNYEAANMDNNEVIDIQDAIAIARML